MFMLGTVVPLQQAAPIHVLDPNIGEFSSSTFWVLLSKK